MPDINELHRIAASARMLRDAARADLRESSLRMHTLEDELAHARRAGRPNREDESVVARLEREQVQLRERVSSAKRDVASRREDAIAAIGPLLADPRDLISQLTDAVPFVLFPVRIETKFARGQSGDELRVRIFPDDIAVAHHEKMLTAGERDAGENYWRSRSRANAAEAPADREKLQREAWNSIAPRYGAYRTSWISIATRPTNWSETIDDPLALNFPNVETKPLGWTDTPRSPVMPDLFAVVLEQGEASRTVLGKVVPDDLPLGPDPLQVEGFLTRDSTTQRLRISDDLRWLIEFDFAESVGMGVRIPLTSAERTEGFDRILVIGLRLSSDRVHSAALLSQLIESHRYSHGMSIVPQGAPTNNTDDVASGLTTATESVDETYTLEHDITAFPISEDPMRQFDGERLANAIGVPIETVRALPNARRADIAESVAINRALWSATLGNFAKEMLEGAFSEADVGRVQRFLIEFVQGRGLVPAVRVGAQPYGVVITSSFDDWAWSESERGDEGEFWDGLLAQLSLLRKHWKSVADSDVHFVGKRDLQGTLVDPFETLINIIGLQASSVEFWSRTGVPDSYLNALATYRGNDATLVNNWIGNAKNNRLLELKNAHLPPSTKAKLKGVLFLDTADPVTSPIVDEDPSIPLSETRTIRSYDGVVGHNYIYWLATASNADLQNERFIGANGKSVPAPTALLYRLLRVASLTEVHSWSRVLAERVRADVFASAPGIGDMPNISEPVLMPAHYAMVDTAKLGLTGSSSTAGDYLLTHARSPSAIVQKPPEAATLATLTDALRVLADLPTARLERLLAEHIDVVSHRLDAWLTGVFARRLTTQRSGRRQAPGSYLGAYGWVLDVRPATDRHTVSAAEIPPELSTAIDGPVVRYANNGGFVHAPSLAHAVTAAVLRNAYLTHAEPKSADRMSVNLSSARVRTALKYLEGLQNGQELSALLGYQLERGLHENHPGIELDSFIYVLRERFPLISKKLTSIADGVPTEVIEARNVVNGYDLLDFSKGKSYPYGLAGLPNPTGSAAEIAQAGAIAQEVDRLRDAMDAIADLLLAESVHQAVQGNYARARGALQALTDGELAPLPEVVQTPRTGKSLTHRVAVFFDTTSTAGWNGTLTPRAAANAPLNHWLTTVIPDPEDIQWKVTLGLAASEFIDLRTLRLEPIDVVLMSGERLGDFSSGLEQLLVHDFRVDRGVPDEVATLSFPKSDASILDKNAVIFDTGQAQPGKYSLGSILPLFKALRRIITASRSLGARDLMRATEAQHSHSENPHGYDGPSAPLKDLAELKGRLEKTHAELTTHRAALHVIVATMSPLADALEQDTALPVQPAWSGLLVQLRARLRSLLEFGVAQAMPAIGATLARPFVMGAFAQATAVELVVGERLAQSRKRLDIAFTDPLPLDVSDAVREKGRRVTARFDAYMEAGQLLLSTDYRLIPLFTAHAEGVSELTAATTSPVESDGLAIESWLQSLTHIRPAMQAWGMVATYHEWLEERLLEFVPVQLPVAPGSKWIGSAFGNSVKADDVLSIAMHNPPTSYTSPIAGLLVDEWTELVPTLNETTGVAMHINRPNAVAPQAVLVAVAPKQNGHWSWTDIISILHDTMDRARLRAVEPDDIKYPFFQLLPPIVNTFDDSKLTAAAKFAGSSLAAGKS